MSAPKSKSSWTAGLKKELESYRKHGLSGFYLITVVAVICSTAISAIFLYELDLEPTLCIFRSGHCIAALIIFLTLGIEYTMDVCMSLDQLPLCDTFGRPLEHKLGHSLILISLFPLSCSLGIGETSDLRILYIIIGQIVALTGQLGNLQTFYPDVWGPIDAGCILITFGLSRLIAVWPLLSRVPSIKWISPRDSHLLLCLAILLLLFRGRQMLRLIPTPGGGSGLERYLSTSFFLSLYHVALMVIFFLAHIVITMCAPTDKAMQISYDTIMHTILVISATILLGRFVRYGLKSLQKEIEVSLVSIALIPPHEVSGKEC